MMSSWDKIVSLLENYFSTFLNGVAATLILAIVGTLVGLGIGILIAPARNLRVRKTIAFL